MRKHLFCILYSSISFWTIPSNRHPPRLSLFTPITRPSKLEPIAIEAHAIAERSCGQTIAARETNGSGSSR